MYELFLEGSTRNATFEIDEDGEKMRCVSLEIEEDTQGSRCDFFNVMILERSKKSKLVDGWMTLVGQPWEIYEAMGEEFPMAIMESEAIFRYLDTIDPDADVIITYPLEGPSSKIVRDSKMHQIMRGCQRSVTALLYGMPESKVKVLEINK